MKKYVSIDIGGTAIKYGVIDESGSIVVKDKMDTEAYKGGPEILKKVTGIVAGTWIHMNRPESPSLRPVW